MFSVIQIPEVDYFPDAHWSWKVFAGFAQDTQGYTDDEGIDIPPSFAWIGTIKGQRRKDGGYFYKRIRISGREGESIDAEMASLALRLGLEIFEEYATCDCVVGTPCKEHRLQ